MKYKIADLVTHIKRPNSYGFVDSIDPIMICWYLGRKNFSEPEECYPDDLRPTVCDTCKESQCWCGIGR